MKLADHSSNNGKNKVAKKIIIIDIHIGTYQHFSSQAGRTREN